MFLNTRGILVCCKDFDEHFKIYLEKHQQVFPSSPAFHSDVWWSWTARGHTLRSLLHDFRIEMCLVTSRRLFSVKSIHQFTHECSQELFLLVIKSKQF